MKCINKMFVMSWLNSNRRQKLAKEITVYY